MKAMMMVVLLLMPVVVNAGCRLNGVEYPTGAVVDGYECRANGQWTRR